MLYIYILSNANTIDFIWPWNPLRKYVDNAESCQNLNNYKKSLKKRLWNSQSVGKKISELIDDIKTQKMEQEVCTRDVKWN